MLTNLRNRISRVWARHSFAAGLRPTDVFIVTYPKSGTTWLGFPLANYLRPDLRRRLSLNNLHEVIPDINDAYFKAGTDLSLYANLLNPRFFVVHALFDRLLPNVVYMVRDPRDTLVSYYHHHRLIEPGFSASMKEFLSGPMFPCAWEQHVAGWLIENRHPRMLVLKYEEMHANVAEVASRALRFAGVTIDEKRLAEAIEEAGFGSMQTVEDRFGVEQARGEKTERFIRRGKVGGWKDELCGEELRLIEERCAKAMRVLGYSSSDART